MKITAETLAALRGRPALYAARSKDGGFIKFGYSQNLATRFTTIDYNFPMYAPFVPIGACRADRLVETRLHWMLRPLRVAESREIYPAVPVVLSLADKIAEAERLRQFSRRAFANAFGDAYQASLLLDARAA